MMETLIESGRLVDLILAFVLVECAALFLLHRLTGKGPTPRDVAFLVLPGVCLFLALRAALTGQNWVWIAAWLTMALVAHLCDLANRWPR